MIDLALSAQVIVWLFVIALFLGSGQASFFHPVTWYLAFHGLVFVARPLMVYAFGFETVWNYMGWKPDPEEFTRTLAVTSLGLVVFTSVCVFTGRMPLVFAHEQAPSLSRAQRRALAMVTILLLPVIVYSIYRAGGDTGGSLQAGGVYILTKTTGYVTDAQFMLAPLLCLWLVNTRFHWFNLIPILVYLGYRTWCGWARWTILLFVLTLAMQYCWYQRRRWLPAWLVPVTLLAFLLFNVLGKNREILKTLINEHTLVMDVSESAANPGLSREDRRRQLMDGVDFANFDYLAAVVSVVPHKTETYTYGAQYLQLFTEPIPRILWPGKPVGAPVSFFNLNHYVHFVGLTVTLVGDAWMSGGWVGLIVLMALAGALAGWAHRSFWTRSRLAIPSMLYLTFLGIAPNWYRDGGISIFKFLLFTWIPLLLVPLMAWLLDGCKLPNQAMLLRPGECLRVKQPEPGIPSAEASNPQTLSH